MPEEIIEALAEAAGGAASGNGKDNKGCFLVIFIAIIISVVVSLTTCSDEQEVDNLQANEPKKPISERAGEATGNYLYSTWDTIQKKRAAKKAEEEAEEQRQKEIEQMENAIKKKNEGPSLLDKLKSKFKKDDGEQDDGDEPTNSE